MSETMTRSYEDGFLDGENHYKKYMYGVLRYLESSLKSDHGDKAPVLPLETIIKLLEDVEEDNRHS